MQPSFRVIAQRFLRLEGWHESECEFSFNLTEYQFVRRCQDYEKNIQDGRGVVYNAFYGDQFLFAVSNVKGLAYFGTLRGTAPAQDTNLTQDKIQRLVQEIGVKEPLYR